MYSASMEEEGLGAWLGLGIGGGGCELRRSHGEGGRPPPVQFDVLFPELVKEEKLGCERDHQFQREVGKKGGKGGRAKVGGDEDRRRLHDEGPSDGGEGSSARKKLRLTKEQSTLLEDSFRVQNILSHAQKQELARQLNLSPRQVEVWFQNRRARTKLKQTEVDCEFLKRCCESLTGENQRLKHELLELQRAAADADMVNFCPSCNKVTVMSASETSSKSSSSFS